MDINTFIQQLQGEFEDIPHAHQYRCDFRSVERLVSNEGGH